MKINYFKQFRYWSFLENRFLMEEELKESAFDYLFFSGNFRIDLGSSLKDINGELLYENDSVIFSWPKENNINEDEIRIGQIIFDGIEFCVQSNNEFFEPLSIFLTDDELLCCDVEITRNERFS